MPTYTTNYNLGQPLINNAADANIWGNILNTDLSTIDTLLLGALTNNVVTVNSTSTVSFDKNTNNLYNCDAGSGNITLTLPSAVTVGSGVRAIFKKTDSSTNSVTVAAASGQTIDGAATVVIGVQNNSIQVVSNGANWLQVGATLYDSNINIVNSSNISAYLYLPNNFIVQFGRNDFEVTDASGAPITVARTITFPKAFTTFTTALVLPCIYYNSNLTQEIDLFYRLRGAGYDGYTDVYVGVGQGRYTNSNTQINWRFLTQNSISNYTTGNARALLQWVAIGK